MTIEERITRLENRMNKTVIRGIIAEKYTRYKIEHYIVTVLGTKGETYTVEALAIGADFSIRVVTEVEDPAPIEEKMDAWRTDLAVDIPARYATSSGQSTSSNGRYSHRHTIPKLTISETTSEEHKVIITHERPEITYAEYNVGDNVVMLVANGDPSSGCYILGSVPK